MREFVAEFRGLSGTAKQKAVLEATGLSRAPLSELVDGQRDRSGGMAAVCSRAMQAHSKPVSRRMLGIIGREHFQARFEDAGCEMESFDYRQVDGRSTTACPGSSRPPSAGAREASRAPADHRRELVARASSTRSGSWARFGRAWTRS